ncbi:putative SKP1/BTB/POZ domain superfamily, NPH3 domain, NPH3/RPT2-like family protein [Helianthus annuus]|nr:putative SKP1/BTB/POZ domain superfamily, NPH3 domain, NPH3/RPT2-like family protein [Helianthus annuus]KAJ0631308.1 putative SKP1/BTB/POZ domain superfamily, NPH3 domain, NPH3/RPT2-like family protein [Helianthus annuus]KAJ0635197.1 putative SKP1/BTB/POZ domain superfamily, NPH3 domain, NPH3/RPT2-like family protein [Helianthus annuus]KAJ0811866.1 putative SKP1/BTB/POZ domain superfamily, NPH3 domain-containing protein [Helianthus annuus]KAJ0824950.1 putative SKP1/BTB/POZ domain superfamily
MKFMKLGSRPDAFYNSAGVKSISSEVRTDIIIQVNETRYLLHKFPLLSKCLKLQKDCSEDSESSQLQMIELADFPGGCDAFELCIKFCYRITITLSAYNIVAARCAARYLQMTEDVEKGNLVNKLEAFFNSCILNGWKDCIVTLHTTKPFQLWSDELGITSRCIESLVSKVLSNPLKVSVSHKRTNKKGEIEEVHTTKRWWGEDLSELRIDLYWRTMAALKSGRKVPPTLIGDALKIYTSKWLPKFSKNLNNGSSLNSESDPSRSNSRMLLESIITLLPIESNAVSCSFLLKLLKAVNILQASSSSKLELARKVALQLDEAKVSDLMIPFVSNDSATTYDLDIVLNILEQFMLQSQSQSQQTSSKKPLQSCDDGVCELEGCKSSSAAAVNGAMVKVAKLVDGFLQEIARDVNVPLSKFIAFTEAVPELARLNHDDLYKAIDIYLKSHPELNKRERKDLCRTLDCKKLSLEACMHAAQNEQLPLRVVVQVLFSEQARAAMAGGHVTGLPNNIKALLAAKGTEPSPAGSLSTATSTPQQPAQWVKSPNPSVSRSKTNVDAGDESADASLKAKEHCSIPSVPKKTMLSKLWSTNRVENEK